MIKELLGFNRLTEAAEQNLEGTLFHNTDEECFPGVREFVAAMAIPEEMKDLAPLNTQINLEYFTKEIREWKESTSNSPSGNHLGHYKVALQDKEISEGYSKMINMPVRYGFSPSR